MDPYPCAVSCTRQHLTREGQAILVVPNPDKCFTIKQYRTVEGNLQDNPILNFIEPKSGNPIQVYALEQHEEEKNNVHVAWAFDELFPDGRVRRFPYNITYHLRSIDDTISLIDRAGMVVREVAGDYQLGPPDPSSEELIFVVGLR